MNSPALAAPRKFTAPTSREALRLARSALGKDALVLAARPVADGFEVVVIADEDAAELVQAATPVPMPPAAAGDGVLSELLSMRNMLEERLETVAWNEAGRRDPVRGRLLRTMLQAGFSPKLCKALLDKLAKGRSYEAGLAFVRGELVRALPVYEGESELMAAGGVYALVGPTGAGKTTTTAKLAARFLDTVGADHMALVTIDTFRIGASQQLQIYGQMMNIPVFVAKDKTGLAAILGQLRDKRLVLIDTEGRSQRDMAVGDQVTMLAGLGVPVRRLLLLDARSQGDALNETVYSWQRAGHGNQLAGCVFTKLDEATSRGALLDTAIRHRLPVHYLSTGQRVPEDLETPRREQLVDETLSGPAPGALFTLDPDLAAVMPSTASDEAARARAEAERLRVQCKQLIRTIAHDAQELAAAAAHLEAADVGFAAARRLWRSTSDADLAQDRTLHELQALARTHAAQACDRYVLAVCGRARIEPNEHGDTFDLQSCVLLSDRTGQPFAAPNQWLATGGDPKSAARQLQWLRQQDFGRRQVHLLPRAPAGDDLARWTSPDHVWVARAPASMVVIDPATGANATIGQLAFEYGPAAAVVDGAQHAAAQAERQLLLKGAGGEGVAVRCVARRLMHDSGSEVGEPLYLLSNIADSVPATQLAQWQEWALCVDSCFRLTSRGVSLLGGISEIGAPGMMKRLLIAGQVATTAWRVLQGDGEPSLRTRSLLTELAGRQARAGRPHTASGIYEGLVKLFQVLDALVLDAADLAGSEA